MSRATKSRHLEASPALRRYDSVRDLIATPENPTPLVRLNRVVPPGEFQLYLKLEWFNPFGSIKDRAALYLLDGLAGMFGQDFVHHSLGMHYLPCADIYVGGLASGHARHPDLMK